MKSFIKRFVENGPRVLLFTSFLFLLSDFPALLLGLTSATGISFAQSFTTPINISNNDGQPDYHPQVYGDYVVSEGWDGNDGVRWWSNAQHSDYQRAYAEIWAPCSACSDHRKIQPDNRKWLHKTFWYILRVENRVTWSRYIWGQ